MGKLIAIDRSTMELEGLRKLVADCVEKHCYRSAIFFGDKVCLLSGEEDRDVYQLCQAYFYSGQHGRALNRLTRHRESRDGEGRGADWEGHKSFRYLAARCLAESQEWERCLQTLDEGEDGGEGSSDGAAASRRDVAVSLFSKRMDTSEEEGEPGLRRSQRRRGQRPKGDGGSNGVAPGHNKSELEIESAMNVLRARCYESMDNRERAKQHYVRALEASDPFCYEAFEALIGNHMLTAREERDLFDNLDLGRDAQHGWWLKALYECKGKKYGKVEEVQGKLGALEGEEFGLSSSLDVLTCKAEFLYHCCEYRRCYEVTQRVLQEDPHHLDVLPCHLACAVELGRKNDLFLLGHQLVEEHPARAVSWFAVGCYYLCISQHDSAERYFQKATGLEKDFAPAWMGYGHAFAYQDESDQAMAAYRTAARLFIGLHLPLLCLGIEYMRTNSLPLAEEFFTKARAISPEDPFVLNELGVLAFQRKQYSLAVKQFKKALSLIPDPYSNTTWEPTVNNLAHALRKTSRFQDAIEMYTRALALTPKQANTYSAMAFTYQLMGQPHRAIELYHKSLGIEDDAFTSDMLFLCLKEVSNPSMLML